jgi:Fe-S cluster assembly protein SufD
METKLSPHALTERFLAEAEAIHESASDSNPLLQELRSKALDSFRKQGIPTKKTEEYRYIDFVRFLHDDMRIEAAKPELRPSFEAHSLIDFTAPILVLVNGYFEPSLSCNCEGITALSIADGIAQRNADVLSHLGLVAELGQDPFIDLNTACFRDGLFLKLEKRSQAERPIQVIQLGSALTPLLFNPRILVLAEKGCDANLVCLTLAGVNSELTFSNSVIELHLEEQAQIRLVSIQQDAGLSTVTNTVAHIAKGANLQHVSVSLEGQLIRNNVQAVLTESGSEANLFGYYHPTENSIFDNHTLVDHRQAHCQSNELYKGVVDGKATAIFNGKIFVRKNAQKTNAFQSNKNILLSADATVNTKPQLEIYADDVKCSHGSSTGLLDPDQLFYLRARGISLPKAKALLLHAYAGEILNSVSSDFHRDALRAYLEKRFES